MRVIKLKPRPPAPVERKFVVEFTESELRRIVDAMVYLSTRTRYDPLSGALSALLHTPYDVPPLTAGADGKSACGTSSPQQRNA